MGYNISKNSDTHVVIVTESGSYIDDSTRFPVVAKVVGGLTGLTGSLKWEKRTTDLDIDTSDFTTFWEKTEPGALYGALFKLDDEDMEFQVEVDGEIVLNCHLKNELKDEFKLDNNDSNGGNALNSGPPFLYSNDPKHYRFVPPPDAFQWKTSVKLRLKADKTNKDLENYMITWRSA